MDSLSSLEQIIHYQFNNPKLLHQALTHSSYASENDSISYDNERLEFLGDSIIGSCVSFELYHTYPNYTEGDLTLLKSYLVSKKFLAQLAMDINLGDYVFIGAGEEKSGARSRISLLGNTFEALIGAIWLDSTHEQAHTLVWNIIKPKLADINWKTLEQNFKNILQIFTQKRYGTVPHYTIHKTSGEDGKKYFFAHVGLGNTIFGTGLEESKKKATFKAAQNAVKNLELL